VAPSIAPALLLALALNSQAPHPLTNGLAQPPPRATLAPSRPAADPPVGEPRLAAAIASGRDYLCRTQNRDGSWGSPRWTGGVDRDPVPGAFLSFGTATTALCLEALLAAADSPAIEHARARGEQFLVENLPKLRRPDPYNLPNIWGHAYGIQVLAELAQREPAGSDRRRRFEQLIGDQIKALEHFETVTGGWFYYASGLQRPEAPSASFVNAAVLIALDRARPLGIRMDERVEARAIRAIADQRNPDSSYLYSFSSPLDQAAAKAPINRPAGSLGRSQACNLALRLWGDRRITDSVLKEWLDRLVNRNGWLDMGRKRPIPHESFAQVAGYFFYFGHYYGALCMGQLPANERSHYQNQLGQILVRLQEDDGSWFDYPLYSYHKAYGTAFALLALECCRAPRAPGIRAERAGAQAIDPRSGSKSDKPVAW
jgi:hypothetical protein